MHKLLGKPRMPLVSFLMAMALAVAFVPLTVLAVEAAAVGSTVSTDPASTTGEVSPTVLLELGSQLFKALATRDWRSLGFLAITLLVMGIRWLAKNGPKLPSWKWLSWLRWLAQKAQTDRGGAVASLVISAVLVPIGALLGGASPLSWTALGSVLFSAATATGTFVLVKKIIWPSDKESKPALKTSDLEKTSPKPGDVELMRG